MRHTGVKLRQGGFRGGPRFLSSKGEQPMTHASIQHTTNVQQDAMSASSANQSGQRRRYVVQVQTNAPREMSDDCAGRALWPQVGQTSKNRIQPSSLEESGRFANQARSTYPLPLTYATSPKPTASLANLRQLVTIAQRQDCSPKALLSALAECPEVARRLMASVNSGRFALRQPVDSLLAAHLNLGQNTFRQLVLVSASLERTPLAGQ